MRCKPRSTLSFAQRPWSHRAPHTRDGSGVQEQSKTPLAGSLTSSKSQPQPSRGNKFQQGSSPASQVTTFLHWVESTFIRWEHHPTNLPADKADHHWSQLLWVQCRQPLQLPVGSRSTTFKYPRLLPPARQQVFVMQSLASGSNQITHTIVSRHCSQQ